MTKEYERFFEEHNSHIVIGNIGSGTKCSLEELYQAFKARLWDEFEENEVVELENKVDDDE